MNGTLACPGLRGSEKFAMVRQLMRAFAIALVFMLAFAWSGRTAYAAVIPRTQQAPAVNAAFVNAAFQVLFNRPASASDIAYWTNPALASQGQAAVVQTMINSPAFRQIEVGALVQHFLGRTATSADVTAFGNAASMAQVAAAIIASQEYYAKAGGTIATFLAKVYTDAVGNSIPSSAIVYFNGLFTSSQGISSTFVATSIEQSPAGANYLLLLLYQNALHRSGTPTGPTLVEAALAAIQQTVN